MNNFKLNQNKSNIESVNTDIIEKLAEISKVKDNNQNIGIDSVIGSVTVRNAYKDSCDYLTNKYQDLSIIIQDDYFIRFACKPFESLLVNTLNISTGGITLRDANAVTDNMFFRSLFQTNNYGTATENRALITSFDEIKYFTNYKIIRYDTFSGCSNLTSIDLSGIDKIEGNAFNMCTSLTTLKGYKHNIKIAPGSFQNCNLTGDFDFSDWECYEFDDKGYAYFRGFENNKNLTSIIMPSSHEWFHIGGTAFQGCTSLTSLSPMNKIKVIDYAAFVNVPIQEANFTNLTSIQSNSFNGILFETLNCPNLTNIPGRIGGVNLKNVTLGTITNLDNGVFENANYTNLNCDLSQLTQLPNYVFKTSNIQNFNGEPFETLNLPNITKIGFECFNNQKNIKEYKFENLAYRTIDDLVNTGSEFRNNSVVEKITISSETKYLPAYFVYYSSKMKTLIGAENIEIIPDHFAERTALTEARFSKAKTINGNYNFANCKSLTTIQISSECTSIPDHFANSCTNLTTLIGFDGITEISNYAFSSCSNLTSIDATNNLIKIGEQAFFACSELLNINLTNINEIKPDAFNYCTKLNTQIIYTGDHIYRYAFANCTALVGPIIFENCTNIESGIFDNCPNISYIRFNNNDMSNLTLGTNPLGNTSYTYPIYVKDDQVANAKVSLSAYASRIRPISELTN